MGKHSYYTVCLGTEVKWDRRSSVFIHVSLQVNLYYKNIYVFNLITRIMNLTYYTTTIRVDDGKETGRDWVYLCPEKRQSHLFFRKLCNIEIRSLGHNCLVKIALEGYSYDTQDLLSLLYYNNEYYGRFYHGYFGSRAVLDIECYARFNGIWTHSSYWGPLNRIAYFIQPFYHSVILYKNTSQI